MNQHAPLATHLGVFKAVRDRIADEFDLSQDDEAVLGTAEGETDLTDYLAHLLREGQRAEAQAKGMSELIRQNQERKARLEAKAGRLRTIVQNAMADAGLPKLTAPDFTASRGRSQPAVDITDAEAVPDAYCRIRREPDRAKIGKALKDGERLNFATLGDPREILTIRSA